MAARRVGLVIEVVVIEGTALDVTTIALIGGVSGADTGKVCNKGLVLGKAGDDVNDNSDGTGEMTRINVPL